MVREQNNKHKGHMSKTNGHSFDLDAVVVADPNMTAVTTIQAALEANVKEDAERAKTQAQRYLREADGNVNRAVSNLRDIRKQERQHTKHVKLLVAAKLAYVTTGDWSKYQKDVQGAYYAAFNQEDRYSRLR